MLRSVFCLAALLAAFAAMAQPPKGVEPGHIELHADPTLRTSVRLTMTNLGKRPAFFLRPDRPWHWYGWTLRIDGPDGEYAFYPPPPSPWFAGTESYILLMPGDTFTTRFDLSEAKHVRHAERVLSNRPGPYRVRIAYIFDAGAEIQRAPRGINAVTFAQITGGNFRQHDYGFLATQASANATLVVDPKKDKAQ